MTAIRSFPDAPLALRPRLSWRAQAPAWALAVWHALSRVGQRRAAWELERLADSRALADPVLARQLRAAAAACRADSTTSPAAAQRSMS